MKLLNIEELCEKLDVTRDTVYQWTSQKKIPYLKMGSLLRFDESEIDKWLEKKRVPELKY